MLVLRRYGLRVLEAGTGVEALSVWEEHKDNRFVADRHGNAEA